MSTQEEIPKPARIELEGIVDDVILRQFAPEDSQQLFQLMQANAADLKEVSIYVPEHEWELTGKITLPMPEGRLDFCIWAGEEMIGEIDLVPHGPSRAEVMYWIARQYRGKGSAAKAIETLADYSLYTLGYQTLLAWTGVDNRASQKALEKVGFEEEYNNRLNGAIGYTLIKTNRDINRVAP